MSYLYFNDRKGADQMTKFILVIVLISFIGGTIYYLFKSPEQELTQGAVYKIDTRLDTLKLYYNYSVNSVSYTGTHVALSDTLSMDTLALKSKCKVLYEKDNPQQSWLLIK
jgi:hypothetical protein